MKFASIELLFLIWAVPILALVYFYGSRKRRHILNAYAVQRTLSQIIPAGTGRKRRWRAVLALSGIMFTIVALSGPQYGFKWQEIERKGIDIIIALDCSRSMLATDIKPSRLDRAKREIVDLLNMLQGDRVGLVAFSGTAFLQCPLTIDYPAFYLFLDVLAPDYLPVGGSDLTAALETAGAAFDPQSPADKAVILITDGEHTGLGDPMAAIGTVLPSGAKLFTIGVGSGDSVPVPEDDGGYKKDAAGQIVLSQLDEALLGRMALATGGSYVRSVAGDIDLEAIYEEHIRAGMAGVTMESGRKQIWADRYHWPLTLAVALLLLTRWVPASSPASVIALVLAGLLSSAAPSNAGPLREGLEAYQKEKYQNALKHFINGQLKDPQDPKLLYNIGNAYYKLENFDAAEAHYRQAMDQAPLELKSRLLYNLGNSAYRRGQLEEAVRNYEAALQFDPEDPQIKENLEFVKQQLQRPKQDRSAGDNQQAEDQDRPQQGNGDQQDMTEENASSEQGERSQQKEPSSASESDMPPQPERPVTPDSSDQAEQGENDRPKRPDAAGTGNRTADQKAASKMLNRLKDQPGKAMMPNYKKRTVEKDW